MTASRLIQHTVVLGDCLTALSSVADKSVDLIVTDPPYGQDYSTGRRLNTIRGTTRIANDAGELDIGAVMSEFDRVTAASSHCYVFTSWKTVDQWKQEFEKYFVLKNILIWSKDNHTAGDLYWSYAQSYEMILFGMKGRRRLRGARDRDSVYLPKVKTHQQTHLLQKPDQLVEYLVRKSSRPRDVVLDPFAGSGTVGAVCARLKRNSIQIEIDRRYKTAVVRRLRQEIRSAKVAQEIVVRETKRRPVASHGRRLR